MSDETHNRVPSGRVETIGKSFGLPGGLVSLVFEKVKLLAGGSSGNALIVFAIRVGGAGIALLMQVFLARLLGVEEYGAFVLVWVSAVLAGMMACAGFQTSIIRFVSEYIQKGDKARLRSVLVAAPLVGVVGALVLALGAIFLFAMFDGYVDLIYVAPFSLAIIAMPLLALEEIQDGIARSFDKPVIALAPSFIVRPAMLIIFTLWFVFYGLEANATTAILAAILGSVVATVLQSFFLWRVVRSRLDDMQGEPKAVEKTGFFVASEPGYWVKVSIPVFLSAGFYHLLAHADVLFLGMLTNPQSVAVYYAAIKVLALLHFVLFAVRAASGHHFSRLHTSGAKVELATYAGKMAAWTFWPTLGFSVVMIALAEPILGLFGSQFTGNSLLVVIIALGIVARASVGPSESLLSMTNAQNATAVILALTLACNIVLNLVLIPVYGVLGAALATSVSMMLESAALYAAVRRKLGIRVFVFGSQVTQAAQNGDTT